MFDFSWSEILLIGLVALVVIGPKDLPRVLRTVGQWAGRARVVAREFQLQIDQMVRDSELDDVRKTMNAAVSGDPNKIIKDYVDPAGEIAKSLSAPELMGETATPAVTETPKVDAAVDVPPALEASPVKATIPGPVPPFLQSVLQSEPVPAVPVAAASPVETAAASAETSPDAAPKSGTHG